MSDFVEKPLKKKLNKGNPASRLDNLDRKTGPQPSATIRALDELSPDMGDQIAGRFIAPTDESAEPTDSAFSGSFLSGEPQVMPDGTQDSFIARIIAGIVNLSLGVQGFFFNSLTNGYKHIADDGTTFRKGELGMTNLENRTQPSFGLGYSDNSNSTELLTNGGFETGDFTGWTGVSGTWSVTTVGAYHGVYCASCTGGPTSKTQTVNITGGSLLKITGYILADGFGGATILLQFYDGTAGSGSLISNYTIFGSSIGTFYERITPAPTNAQSVVLSIAVKNGAGAAVFDKVSLMVNSASNYLGFEPLDGKLVSNQLNADDELGQIPVGSMKVPRVDEAKDKLAHTLTTGGAVDVGTHYYITTFVDNYGETDADLTQALTVTVANTTNDGVSLTAIPLGKWGTVARKIYRTKVGGSSTNPLDYFLVTTIGDNTTTSYSDGAADASLSATTIPAVNTTGSRPAYPRLAAVYGDEILVSYTQANFREVMDSAQRYGYYYDASAANSNDGDKYMCQMYLEAGIYTFHMLGLTTTSRARVDWYVDNVLAESAQDWYSGSTVKNVEKTFTYTVPTSGYHAIDIIVNGHNASSTDYALGITKVWATPTAY